MTDEIPCKHGWLNVIIDSSTKEVYCPAERRVVGYINSKGEMRKL